MAPCEDDGTTSDLRLRAVRDGGALGRGLKGRDKVIGGTIWHWLALSITDATTTTMTVKKEKKRMYVF